MDTKKIGAIIHKRRIGLNLSLENIGKALGVNKTTVMRWERGEVANIKSGQLYLLSQLLHLPVKALLGYEVEEEIEDAQVIIKRGEIIELLNKIKTLSELEEAERCIKFFIFHK